MGKTIEPYTDEKRRHFCAACDAEIEPGKRAYEACGHDVIFGEICCSLRCARKFLRANECPIAKEFRALCVKVKPRACKPRACKLRGCIVCERG